MVPGPVIPNLVRFLLLVDRRVVRRYFRTQRVRRLHVGCGPRLLEGWLNSDLRARSRSELRLNAAERLPLPTASFAYVYSEHMIEHLSLPEGRRFLAECRRVLVPGGRIRIATPDLAFLTNLLAAKLTPVQEAYVRWAEAEFLDGDRRGPVGVVNNFFRAWGHQYIYDEDGLRTELTRAGFQGVTRHELNRSDDPVLSGLENEGRMPPGFLRLETMILEGLAPAVQG